MLSFSGTGWKTLWKGNQLVTIFPVCFSERRRGLSRLVFSVGLKFLATCSTYGKSTHRTCCLGFMYVRFYFALIRPSFLACACCSNKFLCEYGPTDCMVVIVEEVKTLFACALENLMAAHCAAKVSRKARSRKADSRWEPEMPISLVPTPCGHVPLERCTPTTGEGTCGKLVPSNALVTMEHIPLSCLDANSPSLQALPLCGRKKKGRVPHPRKVSVISVVVQVTSIGAVEQGGADQVLLEVTASALGRSRKPKWRVSKLVTGMTLKQGCNCMFVAIRCTWIPLFVSCNTIARIM